MYRRLNLSLRVIAPSAYGDRRKLTQALEMGVNDYLTRPVDKNELVARVRTQLRKKRYADRLRHNVHRQQTHVPNPCHLKRSRLPPFGAVGFRGRG